MKQDMHHIKGEPARHPTSLPLLLAGACLMALAGRGLADMTMDDIHGTFSDDFRSSAGVAAVQNAVVGPYYAPGARLALTSWSWAQSYTLASDAVVQPFARAGANFNMTQSVQQCATCLEMVGLWSKEYRAATDLTLGPGAVSVTWYADRFDRPEPGVPPPYTMIPYVDRSNSQYVISGPNESGLVPGEDFTVTFRTSWCDDPGCKGSWLANNLELGQYEVWLGADKRASKQVCIGQAPAGAFAKERVFTGVTLEPAWPDPLPTSSQNRWNFKIFSTMTATGTTPCYGLPVPAPSCSPNCTATLWVSSVEVMAKGHRIPDTPRLLPSDCPPGTTPCRDECIPVGLACGWDTATFYVGSGSYLSPVFDSLSEDTVWEAMWWSVEQNLYNGYPRTPVGLKWRVGNTPDPSTWKANPSWFEWAVPMSVTNWSGGLPAYQCEPPQMAAAGSTTLFKGGAPAVGRYFQYEADFTSHFANGRFPPELEDLNNYYVVRDQHDCYSPYLKGIRVYYKPVRGMVTSQLIRPARLRKWKSISYETDLSSGGSIQVDLLDSAGNVLFAKIPSVAGGFSLASLNATSYPAVRLRAWLDNGGTAGNLPVLKSWGMDWEVTSDALILDRNSIPVSGAGTVTVKVNMNGDREGDLTVHDAAGQLVKALHRGAFPAGVSSFAWKGTNEKGRLVAPGVYFVSLSTPDIKVVKRLVVK